MSNFCRESIVENGLATLLVAPKDLSSNSSVTDWSSEVKLGRDLAKFGKQRNIDHDFPPPFMRAENN